VEVGPGGFAGTPDVSDQGAGGDSLPPGDPNLREVSVDGERTVRVCDANHLAVVAIPAGIGNEPITGSQDRRSMRSTNVQAIVRAIDEFNGIDAGTETGCDCGRGGDRPEPTRPRSGLPTGWYTVGTDVREEVQVSAEHGVGPLPLDFVEAQTGQDLVKG